MSCMQPSLLTRRPFAKYLMNSVEPRALTNNIRYCFPGDVSLEEAAHDQSDQSEMQLMSDGVTAAEIHQLT